MSATEIEALIARARAARRAGERDRVLASLDAAWELATRLGDDHPLPVVVAWKRAKAHSDFGVRASVAACLAPVVERADLLDAYPHGLFGIEKLCRAHQDALGYGDPTVLRLWARLAAHHRESGDLFRAALADLQIAWDAACRGEDVHAVLDRVNSLRPSDLDGNTSWHPEAPDGPGSLPWLHVDTAHTALRAAVWSADHDEILPAATELLHAQTETGHPPRPHVWHALLEARFHGLEAPLDLSPATTGTGFDAGFARALERRAGFAPLAEEAPGPEWALAALWCGVRTGEVPREQVIERATQTGCLAFVQAASRS